MTYDPPTPPCYKDPAVASRTRSKCRECRHFSPCLSAIEDFDRDLHRALMAEPDEGEEIEYDVGAKFAEHLRRHLPTRVVAPASVKKPVGSGDASPPKPSSPPSGKVHSASTAPSSSPIASP